jgi:hypothetical protein
MLAGTHKHISPWLPEHAHMVGMAIMLIGSHASPALPRTFAHVGMRDHDFTKQRPCLGAVTHDIIHSSLDVFVFVDMPVISHGRKNKPERDITLHAVCATELKTAG